MEVGAFGLAAAHIGEIAPVIALNCTPDGPRRTDRLFYNPEVISAADKTAIGPEASVSMQGVQVDVERPVWIEIAYDDDLGIRQTVGFEDFLARCAIHEIEQTQGIFFLERISRLKRDMALKKHIKAQR